MRSTVEAGGADPDNARRSAPAAVTLPGINATRVALTAWSSRTGATPGGYGGHRMRPVTGAAGRGTRRAAGLPPEGRDESCRTLRRSPDPDPGRLRRATLAAYSPGSATPILALHVQGR